MNEFNCEIIPRNQNGRLVRFDVYGSGHKLDAAVKAINRWIESSATKATASSTWAKLSAWEYTKWYEDQLREDTKERQQRFRDAKPEEEPPYKVCQHIGTLYWKPIY